MNKKIDYSKLIFAVSVLLCLLPRFPSAAALVLGVTLALVIKNPWSELSKKYTSNLLQIAVVGLGAGMNLNIVGRVGLSGLGYTAIGITLTFVLGAVLGKLFKIDKNTSLLITVGTAICGGSAIAAVAPVIRAKSQEISVALGAVFLLNSIALIIFPVLGHHFGLSPEQFGLWSALAIHDTSSVVGAAMQFGPRALEVGTTVKLARALWIVPVALVIGLFYGRKKDLEDVGGKFKYPWFILGFLLMASVVTWIPSLVTLGHEVEFVSKRLLVVTLFLIGSNMNREALRKVGAKPYYLSVMLWVIVASGTLTAIWNHWI